MLSSLYLGKKFETKRLLAAFSDVVKIFSKFTIFFKLKEGGNNSGGQLCAQHCLH